MSQFYTPIKTKRLFDPESKEPFKISRSKIELFVNCPHCFYLDRRLGVSCPSGPAFTLNSAVDALLKKEFDIHRAKGSEHPLIKSYGIGAIPFKHPKMDDWRNTFHGIQVLDPDTNFLVFGAVDDIWIENSQLFIVDYKATSTEKEINLDDEWKQSYKRQMEIYQWLARHNQDLKDHKISDTGYFVYCNGQKDKEAFDGKLEFNVEIIPYKGNDSWVKETLIKARKCLMSDTIPEPDKECDFCRYRGAVKSVKT